MAQSFYTRDEAAQVLHVSPEQLDQMRMNGQIAGHEEGGTWKFSKTQVNAIAENRTSVFDSHHGMPGEFGNDPGALPPSEFGSSEMGSSEYGSSEMGSSMGSEMGSSEMGSSEFTTDARPDSSSEFDLGPIGDAGAPPISSSNEFDMVPQQPANLDVSSEFDVGSDIDIGSTPGAPAATSGPTTAKQQPSILKMAPDAGSMPPNEDSLEFDLPPSPSVVGLGAPPAAGGGSSKISALTGPDAGQSEVRLDQLSGSFEFSVNVDSSSRRLAEAGGPTTGPKSDKKPGSSPKVEGQTEDDSDVRLDFDPGAAPTDEELIGIGDKPDSDVRIDPVSEVRSKNAGGLIPPSGGQDLMETEEIDLGAELQQAAEASLAKRPRTPAPSVVKTKGLAPQSGVGGGKTVIPEGPKPTMLPQTSPFELTSDDLGDAGSSLGASAGGSAAGSNLGTSGMGDSALGVAGLGTTGGASEFELTLAPEDEAPKTSPLNLGDDEDIDLGAAPGGKKSDSSNRAELSGINLQVPADSGVLLSGKKKKSGPGSGVKAPAADDESVDFELTLDEDISGPKTLRGKLTDSDSEFELTLDESGSSKSLPKTDGEQKDIFETDFDLQGAGATDESGSQAVALSDEPDTDLESSDFDLALEDDQSAGGGDSLSEVAALDESTSDDSVPKGRTKVLTGGDSSDMSLDDSSLSGVDTMDDQSLLDTGAEEPAPEQEEEAAPMSVPAAQADWGLYPLIMMIPCVVVMLLASLMSYELVHSMYGFHQTSKPSGLLVESFANMFKSDDAQPAAPGGAKAQ